MRLTYLTPLLALPGLSQACLGFDGLLYPFETGVFTLFAYVDSNTEATCGNVGGQDGRGTSSATGPWSADCLPGISLTIAAGAVSGTYTNATGTYVRGLILSNPDFLTNGQQTSFISTPNDCINPTS
ncbi:hypothetical protein PVAG01_02100 [Phlyctema vagabunda]|uniref:Uncharacterized protein n=1 Tax=Phlyctema vagabunda TaxID=108571 RepID=A0ABR4PPM8_9HELO